MTTSLCFRRPFVTARQIARELSTSSAGHRPISGTQTAPILLALSARTCLARAYGRSRRIINNYGWSIVVYVAAALLHAEGAVKGIDILFQETSWASRPRHEGSVINCRCGARPTNIFFFDNLNKSKLRTFVPHLSLLAIND